MDNKHSFRASLSENCSLLGTDNVCGQISEHIFAPNEGCLIYVYIIHQARGQDGWILAEFSFCVFMDRDEVEVHKNVKRERGQYPAILTELAWSIKDILYGIKSTEKNDHRQEPVIVLVYFRALKRNPVKC